MRLLGGIERRVREGKEKERGEEKEISRKKIREASNKIKDRKAAEIDGVPGEMWKYEREGIIKWTEEFCKSLERERMAGRVERGGGNSDS